jgi:hypothetical protein
MPHWKLKWRILIKSKSAYNHQLRGLHQYSQMLFGRLGTYSVLLR